MNQASGNGPNRHLLLLSHAGADSAAALALAKRIEDSPEAKERGLEVWIDQRVLRAGSRWKDQLQQALQDSTAFAVYIGSKRVVNWVWDEVSVALDKAHTDQRYPLIPILADGADPSTCPRHGRGGVHDRPETAGLLQTVHSHFQAGLSKKDA